MSQQNIDISLADHTNSFQPIYQRSVTGMDLTPNNFAVLTFACWIDQTMHLTYKQGYRVTVGTS